MVLSRLQKPEDLQVLPHLLGSQRQSKSWGWPGTLPRPRERIFGIQPIQIGGERLSSQSSAGEGRWGHVNVKRLQHLQHSIGGLAILIRLLQLLHRLLQLGFQFLGEAQAS